MGGANGSHECAPDDKLRDTHPSEFEKMMDFFGTAQPIQRANQPALQAPAVPRMLRSAISAFTRVFDAL
jgi:hypothetical protein